MDVSLCNEIFTCEATTITYISIHILIAKKMTELYVYKNIYCIGTGYWLPSLSCNKECDFIFNLDI